MCSTIFILLVAVVATCEAAITQLSVSNEITNTTLSSYLIAFSPYSYTPCARVYAYDEKETVTKLMGMILTSSSYGESKQSNQLYCPIQKATLGRKRNYDNATADALMSYYPPGSTATFTNKVDGNSFQDKTNTYCMCTTSFYQITLPENYFPRHHSHAVCNHNGNAACLTGEGTCVQSSLEVSIRYDYQNVGITMISAWDELKFDIPKVCACQVLRGSVFEQMV